jgi:hypothetical protein
MREAATRNGDGRGAFNEGEQAKELVATLDDWQKSGDKRLFTEVMLCNGHLAPRI